MTVDMAELELFDSNLSVIHGSHIVFVHGLLGSNEKTWYNGEKNFSWPKVMANKYTNTNVWGYDYKAELSKSILDIAGNFGRHIMEKDEFNTGDIILIGHSFGGLVIKQFIKDLARQTFISNSTWKNFLERIKGVVFLATPHNGSNHRSYLNFLDEKFEGTAIPSYFKPDDFYLIDLARWYKVISTEKKIETYSLYETKPMSKSEIKENLALPISSLPIIKFLFQGPVELIVNYNSASYEINSRLDPVEKSHTSISKPEDDVKDEVYCFVDGFIKDKI